MMAGCDLLGMIRSRVFSERRAGGAVWGRTGRGVTWVGSARGDAEGRYEQAARHLHNAWSCSARSAIARLGGELAGLGIVDGRQGLYERAIENYRQRSG